MEIFLRLSKIYRILLSTVAFFMFAMVGAGSHGGINLKNTETRFSFIAITVFVLTVIMLTVFQRTKQKRWNSWIGVLAILLLSASAILSAFSLYKLLRFDLEESSAWPAISVLSLSGIIILGYMIIKKILTFNS
jgi:hypothetical protein